MRWAAESAQPHSLPSATSLAGLSRSKHWGLLDLVRD
jgi:hypothetical protein